MRVQTPPSVIISSKSDNRKEVLLRRMRILNNEDNNSVVGRKNNPPRNPVLESPMKIQGFRSIDFDFIDVEEDDKNILRRPSSSSIRSKSKTKANTSTETPSIQRPLSAMSNFQNKSAVEGNPFSIEDEVAFTGNDDTTTNGNLLMTPEKSRVMKFLRKLID